MVESRDHADFAVRTTGFRHSGDVLELARKAEPVGLVPDRRLLISIGAAVACLAVLVWMVIAGILGLRGRTALGPILTQPRRVL
jgi:hypothetical protein